MHSTFSTKYLSSIASWRSPGFFSDCISFFRYSLILLFRGEFGRNTSWARGRCCRVEESSIIPSIFESIYGIFCFRQLPSNALNIMTVIHCKLQVELFGSRVEYRLALQVAPWSFSNIEKRKLGDHGIAYNCFVARSIFLSFFVAHHSYTFFLFLLDAMDVSHSSLFFSWKEHFLTFMVSFWVSLIFQDHGLYAHYLQAKQL